MEVESRYRKKWGYQVVRSRALAGAWLILDPPLKEPIHFKQDQGRRQATVPPYPGNAIPDGSNKDTIPLGPTRTFLSFSFLVSN